MIVLMWDQFILPNTFIWIYQEILKLRGKQAFHNKKIN